ncbi:DUF2779 domain-containing protein [Kosmotoga pacifica]|uniref:DUF2779 domain-containing protein n=1 Tax=Kosmotoga pacifica TaxID=1330330 RepID=UPI00069C178F|nr:DUF2779 domain-containing protein [Kosmotoga pacifica]
MVNKYAFLAAINCPVKGWYIFNQPEAKLSVADEYRIREGKLIGRKAQSLFPMGVEVKGENFSEALSITKDILISDSYPVVFEAAFRDDELATRADIIHKHGDKSLDLFEVKSKKFEEKDKFIKNRNSKRYIRDLAYTAMVIMNHGWNVRSTTLLLVSPEYRKGMYDSLLLKPLDLTDWVLETVKELNESKTRLINILISSNRPKFDMSWECKGCKFLQECFLEKWDTLFVIHRLNRKKYDELRERGIFEVEDIDDSTMLGFNEKQKRMIAAIKQNAPVINYSALKRGLSEIEYPAGYLDFETMATALPLYEGIAPYEKIPTQFSLHIRSHRGGTLRHIEYIFEEPSRDCSLELAHRLVEATKDCKSIIVYHASFEKNIIKRLSEKFAEHPELNQSLKGLLNRIIDLEVIVSENLYYPEFKGSFSVKKVLPALVPELGYENMPVSNGDDASYIFANIAMGYYDSEQEERMKINLLEYCKLDTLAMVKIQDKLEELTEECRKPEPFKTTYPKDFKVLNAVTLKNSCE